MIAVLKNVAKAALPKQWHRRLSRLYHRQKPLVLDLHWKLRTDLQVSIRGYGDWVIYNDVFVDGEYDAAILKTLRNHPAGETLRVLDLGANVGFFTLRLIDLMRRSGYRDKPYQLTLIEGSPTVVQQLEGRIRDAGDVGSHVRIIHGLAGERQGSARIVEDDMFHPMNTIMGTDGGGTDVPFVDLDQVITPGTRIDLLKCDIEGAELKFFQNYPQLLRNVQAAVLELHPQLCDAEQCIQLLEAAGLSQRELLRDDGDTHCIHFWR